MKNLFCALFFLLFSISSFCQFGDTASLNAFIRDTIRDRRPDKVTAVQLQKALLGISQFISPASVAVTDPITYNDGQIGIQQATSTTNGYLSANDWSTFNNKLGGTLENFTTVNIADQRLTFSANTTSNQSFNVEITNADNGNTGELHVDKNNIRLFNQQSGHVTGLYIDGGGTIQVQDQQGNVGIMYTDDNYNIGQHMDRWLPDLAAVRKEINDSVSLLTGDRVLTGNGYTLDFLNSNFIIERGNASSPSNPLITLKDANPGGNAAFISFDDEGQGNLTFTPQSGKTVINSKLKIQAADAGESTDQVLVINNGDVKKNPASNYGMAINSVVSGSTSGNLLWSGFQGRLRQNNLIAIDTFLIRLGIGIHNPAHTIHAVGDIYATTNGLFDGYIQTDTLIGGTASNGNLTLFSTTHPNKGMIVMADSIKLNVVSTGDAVTDSGLVVRNGIIYKVAPGGGGGSLAVNGLSVDGSGNVVFGQDYGDASNAAVLTSVRQIPMAGNATPIIFDGQNGTLSAIVPTGFQSVGDSTAGFAALIALADKTSSNPFILSSFPTRAYFNKGAANLTMYDEGGIDIGTSGGTTVMTVLNDGNVGIGTNTPTYNIDVTGTGRITNTPPSSSASDSILMKDASTGQIKSIDRSTIAGYMLHLVGSGTGATTISMAHGLSGITTSSVVVASANNAASALLAYVTVDATNINFVYGTAPGSGTDNLSWSVYIKP